ncbi:MAG: hypothetical protein KAQ90_05470, partial [Melioribacteraceae bacterium]|nr:hypothetical protein [Melioribacteraceae bacterium]
MYQHFKRLFAFIVLLTFFFSHSLFAQTVTIGDYDVTFNGVTNNGDNTSTWSYTVSGIGEDPALSHWVLGLCDDHTVLSSNYSYEVNTDPTTGVYGIKWDKGIEPDESFTFTFTLDGIYDVVDVEAAVKAGQIKSYGDVPGPSCDSDPDCENTLGDLIWHDKNVNGI